MAASILGSSPNGAMEDRFAVPPRIFTRMAIARRDRISRATFEHFEAPLRDRQDRTGLRARVRAIRDADDWVGSLWEQRGVVAHPGCAGAAGHVSC